MLSKIFIASDHAGVVLKSEIKSCLGELGYVVEDYGCDSDSLSVDYPDYVTKLVTDVVNNQESYGILICGTGVGMSIAANRHKKVRAALCYNVEIAKLAREHNNANVLCLGSRYTDVEQAKAVVHQFLNTEFAKGRHIQRRCKNMKTINEDEIIKFSQMSDQWWDQNGKFKPLHMINPIRVQYIAEYINKRIGRESFAVSLLDVGCGGGLLSESMARLGMNVAGIDVIKDNIEVAKVHAAKSNLKIDYQCISIEELAEQKNQYDIITIMEVVEHVDNLPYFFECACKLLKDDGIIFISTINRTVRSWLFAIIGAEYVLKWLPRGIHNWHKFVKPAEVAELLRNNNITLQEIVGMNYNILNNEWQLTKNILVNYIATAMKISTFN